MEFVSKIDHFGLCGQIDQMGATVKNHVGEKRCLVNLTGSGTGRSDPDGDLVFDQVGQIVIGTVACRSQSSQIPS